MIPFLLRGRLPCFIIVLIAGLIMLQMQSCTADDTVRPRSAGPYDPAAWYDALAAAMSRVPDRNLFYTMLPGMRGSPILVHRRNVMPRELPMIHTRGTSGNNEGYGGWWNTCNIRHRFHT